MDVDSLQVQQGCSKRSRHGVRQIERRDGARAGQFGNKPGAAALRLAVDVFRRFLAQFAGHHQRAAQTGQCPGRRRIDSGIDNGHAYQRVSKKNIIAY